MGKRLGVSAAVYVPSETPPVPVVGPPDERLERAGRSWLRRRRAHTGPAAAPRPHPDDQSTAGLLSVAVTDPDGAVVGVLVAAGPRNAPWPPAAREAYRFAVLAHAGDLDGRWHDAHPHAEPDPDERAALTAEAADDRAARPGQDLAADLRAAVEGGELRLAFQPEYDLVSRRIVAAEALVRWQHPRHGELGPEWFLAVAERSDLIRLVGGWVIEQSIAAVSDWGAAGGRPGIQLRVNVSPTQLVDDDFVARVAGALERHGVPGRQVCLELTEHAPMHDIADVAESLRRLKQIGVSCAIDDLTMGYSTLTDLRVLPVDVVKLDRSLIDGIDVDPRARAIVTAVLGLALNFGLEVVAEGVQNEAEIDTLVALGCTRGQGHHLSRPVDSQVLTELLRRQRDNEDSRAS
jgi:EAL domain-containing protein (putative c-di-GMP-specific phosphodiesterase class I)